MLHHDRWPDRKTTRETKKDERVAEAKKEDNR